MLRPNKLLAGSLALLLAFSPCLARAADVADEDAGSGAGVQFKVIQQILDTGRFDLRATLEMLLDTDTLLGAAGGVLGFTVASKLAAAFLPPGMGIFLQMLPRFLGGALGFELARGRLSGIDPIAMTTHVLASAGGYALAHAFFGATAPGWLLMGGATLLGLAVNLLTREKPPSTRAKGPDAAGAPEASVGLPALEAAAGDGGPDALRESYQLLVDDLEGEQQALPELLDRYRQAQQSLAGYRLAPATR